MSILPYRTSYWYERPPLNVPQLKGNIHVDVAIVGGGVAGLSSCRYINELIPSKSIAIVEAEHIGFGASGRCAGFISPLPPMTWLFGLKELGDDFEAERAIWYLQKYFWETKKLLVSEFHDCDVTDTHLRLFAYNGIQHRFLQWLSEKFLRVGLDLRRISQSPTKLKVGARSISGIELDGLAINPYKVLLIMAAQLRSRGVQIFENTRVLSIHILGTKIALETARGSIIADKAILATNAYTRLLKIGKFRPHTIQFESYMIATEPLDTKTLELLSMNSKYDGDGILEFFHGRLHNKRLLFGGCDRIKTEVSSTSQGYKNTLDRLYSAMIHRYSCLADVKIDAFWAGPYVETLSMTPIVGPLSATPDLFLNIGYGEAGLLLANLSGKLIANTVFGRELASEDDHHMLQFYKHSRLNLRGLIKMIMAITMPMRNGLT